MDLPERLRRTLASRERGELTDDGAIRCAVLVPLLRDADDYRVVYTVRTESLPDHRGQVAFPGGKRAADDVHLVDTALREAHEEVGIEANDVEVLGRLDDIHTMAGHYVVTPFVGLLSGRSTFRPNPAEVADLFTVRLGELRSPERRIQRPRSWGEQTFQVDVISAGSHEIWGLTLHITENLLACIDDGRAVR